MRQPRVLKSIKTLYDELVAAQIQGLIRINSKNVNSHIRIEVIINFTVPFETRKELLKHIQDNYAVKAWQTNLSTIEIHG